MRSHESPEKNKITKIFGTKEYKSSDTAISIVNPLISIFRFIRSDIMPLKGRDRQEVNANNPPAIPHTKTLAPKFCRYPVMTGATIL